MSTIGANEGLFGNDMEKELNLLMLEKRRQEAYELERELNLYRSGSAPPTVEGSLRAVSGLFGGGGHGGSAFPEVGGAENGNGFVSDEDLRSDPAYLSYYYANANLNPRLPPPLLSREDLRVAQRLKNGSTVLGGIGDRRKSNNNNNNNNNNTGNQSLISMPPGFESRKSHEVVNPEKTHGSADWDGDGLIGLSGLGLGSKQKSFADIFQDDLRQRPSVSQHPSRSVSRNAFDENTEANSDHVSAAAYSYAAALSRSTTPDPQAVARAPSPCLTPIGSGRVNASEKRTMNDPNSFSESSDLASALSGMNLSNNGGLETEKQTREDIHKHANLMFTQQPVNSQVKQHGFLNKSEMLQNHTFSSRSPRMNGSQAFDFNGGGGSSGSYQNLDAANRSFPNYNMNNYSMNPALASMMAEQLGTGNLPPLYENAAAAAALGLPGADARVLSEGFASPRQNLLKSGSFGRNESLQAPFADPMYLQYLKTSEYAAQLAALNEPSMDMAYLSNSYANNLLDLQKSQYGVPYKSGGYYGSPTYGSGLSYPASPFANHVMPNSQMAPGSPMRNMRFPSGTRNNFSGGLTGHWQLNDGFGSSLLEEFKGNKTRGFELLEISGHVVEFSADQYGSRFIQQKLETATVEEKNMVYEEIMPEALVLMTDVFGNYVIQKFFEHGLPSQRRELAEKLLNSVLPLSLQMYGCRVIQKAIEVVDLDQKIEMVKELDGHVIRCVRDQNGNHVIQKCIECIPEENIQFIVSTFFDQVVTLSTHPYGCRVIQRVLEHCEDPMTLSKVMDEILCSVSMLAQDQYGNYVIQHVLEHGKPHERSVIIKELAGKIVQMSQQKFASNVVEKCLTFGGPTERELLVNEMLGSTDENEPLQAMMKDQFANYVVQKVLETCDDQQRELILSRIKVHLNALKKYTYGKHIVARVEKLVAAGERRMLGQMVNPSLVA